MITPREDVLLAPYTTFKIGGPARYFFEATNDAGVKEAIFWAQKNKQEICILGGGSNILVSDGGFSGLVIRLSEVSPEVTENGMKIFSGCPLMMVVKTAQKNGLSGMERLAGIPGTLGGAVYGNAGAFGTEMKDVVTSVTAVHIATAEEKIFSKDECEFQYRQSYFKRCPEWAIVSAEASLKKGESSELLRIMEDTIAQRNSKQTQSVQSAGSYFINPIIEDESLRREFAKDSGSEARENKVPAGWIIDKAGLRGKRMGDAMVSEEHPNYILNVGHATAEEIVMLESFIKQQVRDTFNVELQREVRYVGF